MTKKTDIEQIQRILGIAIEDLSDNNVRSFRGSLTGISKLSPLSMRGVKLPVSQNTEDNQETKKEDNE